MSRLLDPIQPSQTDVTAASAAVSKVREYLVHHPQRRVRLVVDGGSGDTLVVPRGAVELLARVLDHMAAGEGVSVVPAHAELTTQQAADMLNVSRPHLVGLLNSGEIDYRMVGSHRRVQAASLMEYMRRDDQRRGEAADELTRLGQELGL